MTRRKQRLILGTEEPHGKYHAADAPALSLRPERFS